MLTLNVVQMFVLKYTIDREKIQSREVVDKKREKGRGKETGCEREVRDKKRSQR